MFFSSFCLAMPHTIFNIDDNVALTENYLFADALPDLIAGKHLAF